MFLRIRIKIAEPIAKITTSKDIHRGDKTQSHAQLITPVNFRTIKTIVNSPVKPIPVSDEFFIVYIN